MSSTTDLPIYTYKKSVDTRPPSHIAHTKPWYKPSPKSVIYHNAVIVDPVSSSLLHNGENLSILVRDGKIAEVGIVTSQEGIEAVDLEGRYVCPGLIDTHVHVTAVPGGLNLGDMVRTSDENTTLRTTFTLKKMLDRGFTTVRDCGGATKGLSIALAEGLIEGPRLFQCGKALSQTGGHGDFRPGRTGGEDMCCGGHSVSLGRTCDGVPQVLKATREEIKAGADQIKLMCGGGVASESDGIETVQFSAEEIQAITRTAEQMGGLHVTAHAYTVRSIMHAIDNGIMGIEHGNLLDEPTAKIMASKGIFYTPTLACLQVLNRPPFNTLMTEAQISKSQEVMNFGLRAVQIAHAAGVTLCYGSDMLASMHPNQTEEFAILAGLLPAPEVLKMATINPAKLLRQEGLLGVIAPGAMADMIVLTANPLSDVSILDQSEKYLVGVIQGGLWKQISTA